MAERYWSYLAKHDALTGLVNRREFEQRLEHVVASSKAYGGRHALGYLDLDQFKIVNDTAGHAAGDEMLKQVASLLKSVVRERDALARLGGDEFGLLLDNCPLDKALQIADVLVANLKDFRFTWKGRIFQIGVSIGLVPITRETESTAQLLSQADVACYTAKALGRNQVYVYQPEDSEPNLRHSEILRAAELRDALEQNRFRLYCQPIVPLSLDTDEPVHYELLLRLLDGRGELIMPGAFIPAAERYGLMAEIDRWVIRMAFRRAFQLVADAPGAYVAINLSGNSLNDDRLARFVRQALSDSHVPPEQICFEITETAAIQNLNKATRFVTEMKKQGCRFALDDFGSGLSSFAYLKKLPVDYLKIAGSFVPDMVEDRINCAMVTAISDVGRIMGIKTIAEHADTSAVVEKLREVGVAYAQGAVFGSPQPFNLETAVDRFVQQVGE